MPALTVAVQPPSRTKVSTILYPPLVAEFNFKGSAPGFYFFAMAVLLTRNGNIVEHGLSGTVSVTGMDVTSLVGSSRTTIYFPFTDLSLLYDGAYKIRVDVYKVAHENSEGYIFQDQIKTNRITVVNEDVPAGTAGSSERSVIRTLRSAGVQIP